MMVDVKLFELVNTVNEVVAHPNNGIGAKLELGFQLAN